MPKTVGESDRRGRERAAFAPALRVTYMYKHRVVVVDRRREVVQPDSEALAAVSDGRAEAPVAVAVRT
jgi:hypothetical protein